MWITCELLLCFNKVFGLSFWRHPFTAEDPFTSKWCNTKCLQICSNEKQTHLHIEWPEGEQIVRKVLFLVELWLLLYCFQKLTPKTTLINQWQKIFWNQQRNTDLSQNQLITKSYIKPVFGRIRRHSNRMRLFLKTWDVRHWHSVAEKWRVLSSGGPLSALTCCVNVRLLSAIKKISPLIYSQSWVGSWVYTTQAMMTFTLIF